MKTAPEGAGFITCSASYGGVGSVQLMFEVSVRSPVSATAACPPTAPTTVNLPPDCATGAPAITLNPGVGGGPSVATGETTTLYGGVPPVTTNSYVLLDEQG